MPRSADLERKIEAYSALPRDQLEAVMNGWLKQGYAVNPLSKRKVSDFSDTWICLFTAVDIVNGTSFVDDAVRSGNITKGKRAIRNRKVKTPDVEIGDCGICLDVIAFANQKMSCKRCRNVSHTHCLLRWISLKNSCPFCRSECV